MVDPITLDGEGAERAAEIFVRRGKAVRKHASPGCACGTNMIGEEYVDPICRAPDEVEVPALVDIVKEQWRAEHVRAEQLQKRLDEMTAAFDECARMNSYFRAERDRADKVVAAAQKLVRGRNEQHGDPSKPAWWYGYDWDLVIAITEYDEALRKE